MPNTPYTRSTPEAKTLIAALKCPPESPWHRLALRNIERALRQPTKRAAAEQLGMHETALATLLTTHGIAKRPG